MKKKIKHVGSVHVVYHKPVDSRVKIEVFEFPEFSNVKYGEFWVPESSMVQLGNNKYVPNEILKARMKHDFGITFDHHSALYGAV